MLLLRELLKVDVRLNRSDSCGLVSGASVARDAVVVGTWVVVTGVVATSVVGNGVVSTSVKLVIGVVGARDVFTTAVVGGAVVLTTGLFGVAVVLAMGVVEGAVVLTIGVVDKDGVVVDSVEVVLLCVTGPDVTLTELWADVNTFMGADVPLSTMCVVDRFTGSDVALTTMFVVDLFEGAEVAFMTVYGVDIGGSGVEVVVVAEVETTPGRQQIIRYHFVCITEDVLILKKKSTLSIAHSFDNI